MEYKIDSATSTPDQSNASTEGETPDYMKYSTGTGTTVAEDAGNTDGTEGTQQKSATARAEAELQSLDMTFVPEHLRGKDPFETLQNVEKSRKESEKKMTQNSQKTAELERIMQRQGYNDPVEARLGNVSKEISHAYQSALSQAERYLLQQVEQGVISEADANYEFGKYDSELKAQYTQQFSKEQMATNASIIESLVADSGEILKIKSINDAAGRLIKDIIDDGEIISSKRTNEYLQLADQIYKEAFEAGRVSATTGQQTDAGNQQLKQRMGSVATKKPAVTGGAGDLYETAEDVPQDVWNNNSKVRRKFGVK